MQIRSTINTNAVTSNSSNPAPNADAKAAENGADSPKDSFNLSAEQIVTKGAFAAGGALGGVGLGVVTGNVMNSLANTTISSGVGGAIGGVGGALTALAISESDSKGESMARVFGGWAGSSVGSLAGQHVIGGLGQALSAAGAAPWIGTIAPLAGTAVGGLSGAALPLIGADGKVSTLIKNSSLVGLAGAAGIGAGGLIQLAVNSGAPVLGPAAQIAPVLGAATAGTMMLDSRLHDGEMGNLKATHVLGLGSFGYGVGLLAGGVASSLGASGVAALTAPTAGLIAGGLLGLTSGTEINTEEKETPATFKASGVAAGAGLGTVLGDLGGNVLTNITGNQIYSQMGTAVGALNGTLSGLSLMEVNTHKATPTIFGGTAGVATGALLGTALTALTGQDTWNTVMPILGGVAGGLSGAAAAFKSEKAAEEEAKKAN